MEKFRYIPPKGDCEKPRRVYVTDRMPSTVFEALGTNLPDIKPGQTAVVVGGGILGRFESYLHSKGLNVAVVDHSLGFSSNQYTIGYIPAEGHPINSVSYTRLDTYKGTVMPPVSKERYIHFRRQRINKISESCFMVIAGTIPCTKISDHISDVDIIIDCLGAGSYIDEKHVNSYIKDLVSALKVGGQAYITPFQNSPILPSEIKRNQIWESLLSKMKNINAIFYDTKYTPRNEKALKITKTS